MWLFCQLPKYIEAQKKNIYLEQRSLLRGFLYARFTNTGFKVFRSVLLKDAFLVAAQGATYPPQILQTFPWLILPSLSELSKFWWLHTAQGTTWPSSNIANLSMINLTQSRIIKMIKKDVCGKGGPAANSNKTENPFKIHWLTRQIIAIGW